MRRTNAAEEEPEELAAYYHASESINSKRKADYFGSLVRGHWGGSEIRNHWVRDSQMLEDKTRIRDYNINANLATLRCCMIKLKAQLLTEYSWPEIIETSQNDTAFAYQIISNNKLK